MKFVRIIPTSPTAEQEQAWQRTATVVGHMLGTDRPRTFLELVNDTIAYDRQEGQWPHLAGDIALDLIHLMEAGFVGLVES